MFNVCGYLTFICVSVFVRMFIKELLDEERICGQEKRSYYATVFAYELLAVISAFSLVYIGNNSNINNKISLNSNQTTALSQSKSLS